MDSESTYIGTDPTIQSTIRIKAAQLAGCYGFRWADREDIQQELWLDAFVRFRRFDASRSSRRTFLCRVVNHRIATLIKTRSASCRDFTRCQRSLDEPVTRDRFGQLGDAVSAGEYTSQLGRPSLSWGEHAELRADIDKAIALLPAEQATIAKLLESAGVGEIARQLAVPRATIYRRIAAIREAFGAVGLDQYLRQPRQGSPNHPSLRWPPARERPQHKPNGNLPRRISNYQSKGE
jgi:RNA polymerase sigma-70 factor (ECF subfamily)